MEDKGRITVHSQRLRRSCILDGWSEASNEPLSRVEQIDGRVSIRDQSGLKSQRLKKFDLHIWPRLGHGLDGAGADSIDDLLELGRLDIGRFLGLFDLHVVLIHQETASPYSV